jgi:hypothetical protein
MNPLILLIVSAAGVFGIIYPLARYVPLTATTFGIIWSPRLQVCKLLTIFDIYITLLLILGAWIGISTSVTGISMIVFNIMTGVGISAGIFIVQKWFIPRWEVQYHNKKEQIKEQRCPKKNKNKS